MQGWLKDGEVPYGGWYRWLLHKIKENKITRWRRTTKEGAAQGGFKGGEKREKGEFLQNEKQKDEFCYNGLDDYPNQTLTFWKQRGTKEWHVDQGGGQIEWKGE